jgi:hypothetical protein
MGNVVPKNQLSQDQGLESSKTNENSAPPVAGDRDKFLRIGKEIKEVIRKFDELVRQDLISERIADLYKTKLKNYISLIKTGYDELDTPIPAATGQAVIDAIEGFAKAGYSKDAINALVAIGTGKGGAQGVIEFADLIKGKSTEDVLASLRNPKAGWQSTITYLYQLKDDDRQRTFKSGLEQLFSEQELTTWQRKKEAEDESYRVLRKNYKPAPSSSTDQISADEFRSNPFSSGNLGQKAAEIISTMQLRPGGYCLQNTQNALNRAGFGLGNMGAYAFKSLTHFEDSGKFIEVTGTKEELKAMIKERTLPEGAVVYSSKFGDRRGAGSDPYGDVGIIVADGRIVGYDRGGMDRNGKPRLVYGDNTEFLRVFIPKV